ncbi:hypothetical protein PVAP13_5NG475800 [Panicum virgatum]|uniref:Uncharacterized protein n=1 Tax=Panicum virgatum TaxID=38727 RepID=A0A8T0S2R2_PANVG|nr:hypothetical protein PVAP13_5NG475800 [Panicum virgatum]
MAPHVEIEPGLQFPGLWKPIRGGSPSRFPWGRCAPPPESGRRFPGRGGLRLPSQAPPSPPPPEQAPPTPAPPESRRRRLHLLNGAAPLPSRPVCAALHLLPGISPVSSLSSAAVCLPTQCRRLPPHPALLVRLPVQPPRHHRPSSAQIRFLRRGQMSDLHCCSSIFRV